MELCPEIDQPGFNDSSDRPSSSVTLGDEIYSEEQLVLEEPVIDDLENLSDYHKSYSEVQGISVEYLQENEDNSSNDPASCLSTDSNQNDNYLRISVVGENDKEQYLIIQENNEGNEENNGEICDTTKTEITFEDDVTSNQQLINQYSSNELFFIKQEDFDSENSPLGNISDDLVDVNPEVGHMLEVSYEDPVESETITFPDGLQPLLIPADSSLLPSEDGCPPISLLIDGKQYNIVLTDPDIGDDILNNEMTIQISNNTKETTNSTYVNSKTNSRKSYVLQNRIQHKCKEVGCNKSYSSHHHLQVHMRNHLGIRPHQCPVEGCGKTFSTTYSLIVHIRIHTGEKPYECVEPNCKKAFKTSGDLQRHMRVHTGERPFKCTVDGCEKAFNTNNILKIHLRTHSGEKPFNCDICKKKFPSSTNYRNHMRIHSGDRPYVCSVPGCSSKFTEYSSLYKHGKVHLQKDNIKSAEVSKDEGRIFPTKTNSHQLKKSLPGMPVVRASKAKLKKSGKSSKGGIRLSSSLQMDEIDQQDNMIPLGGDDFEVYQLILDDDFTSCV